MIGRSRRSPSFGDEAQPVHGAGLSNAYRSLFRTAPGPTVAAVEFEGAIVGINADNAAATTASLRLVFLERTLARRERNPCRCPPVVMRISVAPRVGGFKCSVRDVDEGFAGARGVTDTRVVHITIAVVVGSHEGRRRMSALLLQKMVSSPDLPDIHVGDVAAIDLVRPASPVTIEPIDHIHTRGPQNHIIIDRRRITRAPSTVSTTPPHTNGGRRWSQTPRPAYGTLMIVSHADAASPEPELLTPPLQ